MDHQRLTPAHLHVVGWTCSVGIKTCICIACKDIMNSQLTVLTDTEQEEFLEGLWLDFKPDKGFD